MNIAWGVCQLAAGRSLSIGGRPDGLQVLLHAPVAGSLQAGCVVEGFRFLGARLGIEDIDRVHVVVLTADVLVHENGRQAWPNHCSAKGAQLDHVAKALWARLRSGEELVSHDHELAEAAGHGYLSLDGPHWLGADGCALLAFEPSHAQKANTPDADKRANRQGCQACMLTLQQLRMAITWHHLWHSL